MARLVRSLKLDTRSARSGLSNSKANGDVYWRALKPGLALGYYKPATGGPGTWWARYLATRPEGPGGAPKRFSRKVRLGLADDFTDADGAVVFDYGQAQRAALTGEETALERRAAASLTVGQALDAWLENYRPRARSDVALRETAHKVNAVRTALGERKVADLTPAAIRAWMAGIVASRPRVRGKGKARAELAPKATDDPRELKRRRQATANRRLSLLKAALNHAWKEGILPTDAAWRRVRPFAGADQPRTHYLAADQATRLLNATVAPFRPVVHAAMLTGCRWSELRTMRVSQFASSARCVTVHHTKGGKDRKVPLTEEGVRFFRGVTAGRESGAFMFTRADGAPYGAQDQKRPMADACGKAKIRPAIGFHGIRHTYGSLLALEGVPMPVIAHALGHADTRMTERHYAHLAPSYVADTIRDNLPTFVKLPASGKVTDLGERRAARKAKRARA